MAKYCSSRCAQRGKKVLNRYNAWRAMHQKQADSIKQQHIIEAEHHKQNGEIHSEDQR